MSAGSSFAKPNDARREEFRKYLEHAGVMDALTNALVSLYEQHERPDDALEFMQRHFSSMDLKAESSTPDVEALKKELAEAKSQVTELKNKLQQYESQKSA